MIGWSLAAFSAIWGILAVWVFRRFTQLAALRIVRKRLYAHLLGIRLFSEEPALVWRAQKALLADNVRLMALVWKPALILSLLFALLYGPLNSVYGWGPLEVGHSAMVTLHFTGGPPKNDAQWTLLPPPGILVETPAVRNFAERQIGWRIRPVSPVSGILHFARVGGGDVSRSISAGARSLSFYRRRVSPVSGTWTEVDYPAQQIEIAGMSFPWIVWFLIWSTAAAALFAVWPRQKFPGAERLFRLKRFVLLS